MPPFSPFPEPTVSGLKSIRRPALRIVGESEADVERASFRPTVSTVVEAGNIPVMFRKLLVALAPVIVSRIVRMLRPAVLTLPFTTEAGLHPRRLPEVAYTREEVHPLRAVPDPILPPPPPKVPKGTTCALAGIAAASNAARRIFFTYEIPEIETLR